MMKHYKHQIQTILLGLLLLVMALLCWFHPEQLYSDSERRVLAGAPELSWEEIRSGDYMRDFEAYTLDQFPGRDGFRRLKAVSALELFRQLDNNGLYSAMGYTSKLEYPMHQNMMDHAAGRFQRIWDLYLKDSGGPVWLSIIPDKNCWLAEESGRLSLDYDQFVQTFRSLAGEEMTYIDITPCLSLEDYYRTDTHWRQESISDVAQTLAAAMGRELNGEYETVTLEEPFYGVYYGQSALPLLPDRLSYLTNETLENCTLTSYDTGKPVDKEIYDLSQAGGRDPYELFLSGSDALQVLENPNADTDRELIIFRDSFASSLVPLLAEGWSSIVLVDIRYVDPAMLGAFIDFHGQDVLFLYSTLLLNNSLGLR